MASVQPPSKFPLGHPRNLGMEAPAATTDSQPATLSGDSSATQAVNTPVALDAEGADGATGISPTTMNTEASTQSFDETGKVTS